MPAKPKPEKRGKKKKKKTTRGICCECGFIWDDNSPDHFDSCTQQGRVISVKKYRTPSQLYEVALDELCRNITIWRDGVACVINTHECRGESQWGHVVPQGKSNYLKHNLSNSFRQCRGHNFLHTEVQTAYHKWFEDTFGKPAFDDLEQARLDFAVYKWTPDRMRERLEAYNKLWSSRYSLNGEPIERFVRDGYYGDIVRSAWKKEGKI